MHGLQYGKVCRSLFPQHLANTIQLSTQLLRRVDLGAKRNEITRLATRGFLLPESGSSVVCGFHEWTTYGSLAGSFSHQTNRRSVALPAPCSGQHACARPPALLSSARLPPPRGERSLPPAHRVIAHPRFDEPPSSRAILPSCRP
jgi:hypothetical protein